MRKRRFGAALALSTLMAAPAAAYGGQSEDLHDEEHRAAAIDVVGTGAGCTRGVDSFVATVLNSAFDIFLETFFTPKRQNVGEHPLPNQ